MPAKSEKALQELYANLMGEMKVRVHCIERAMQGATAFPMPIVREFCYLELRFLCELIALSCLVAHGDIPAVYSKRIGKQWSAEKIIEEMEKLRPDFYSVPCQITGQRRNVLGGVLNHVALLKPTFPKDELLKLYADTHPYLHRGNVLKLLNSAIPIDLKIDLPQIAAWIKKIHDQFNFHAIGLPNGKAISCLMADPGRSNGVTVIGLDQKPPWLQTSS